MSRRSKEGSTVHVLPYAYTFLGNWDSDDMEPSDMILPTLEDRLGMTVTSGCATISKDDSNLIGISIGGGSPYCPCLYIVQVFDNTPAAREGTLQAGDEITGVNGQSVKGKTKVEVAKIIQSVKGDVNINYNKLHANLNQGKSLDIVMKKLKHRLVEHMSSSTADALGLSRAILQNDSLVKKLQELERNEALYQGLLEHTHTTLNAFYHLCEVYKAFGDIMSGIGVREPQVAASEAFTKFGNAHRSLEKQGIKLLRTVKPMLSDLKTYLEKAIPDTKLTIKKYADMKFEYLSYCLKVKEMDDEEYTYQALQDPLYRVETGNYEYRLILRCRQEARARFAKLRSDVLVKLELLDQKHVQDIVFQLQRLATALATYHQECSSIMSGTKIFPIELDLSRDAFAPPPSLYPTSIQEYRDVPSTATDDLEDDDEDDDLLVELAEEIKENSSLPNIASSSSFFNPPSTSNCKLDDKDVLIDQLITYDDDNTQHN